MRRPVARSPFVYFRPQVDLLEDRLPPGDALHLLFALPGTAALSLLPPPIGTRG